MEQISVKLWCGLMLSLLVIGGITEAGGASYCNISNTTIAAICANLTSLQQGNPSLIANIAINTNAISTLQSNSIQQWNYVNSIIVTNQTKLWSNLTRINDSLHDNVSTIAGINTAISGINSTANNAKAIAQSANSNATTALAKASKASNQSTEAINALSNVNQSLNQKSQILNSNISTVSRILGPIANLNLTGTYATTQNKASGSGGTADLALILVIALMVFEAGRFVMGRRNKPKIDSTPPIMNTEAKAKAQKTAKDNSNAEEFAKLKKIQEEMETKAKQDKLMADPEYKPLKEKLDKDMAKMKKLKLDMDVSALASYKSMQALAKKYEIELK